MITIKLCAYINLLLTNYASDKVFCYFLDVIEPKLIGDISYEQWVEYETIIVRGLK